MLHPVVGIHADRNSVAIDQVSRQACSRVKAPGKQYWGRSGRNRVEQKALRLIQWPCTFGQLEELQLPAVIGKPCKQPCQLVGVGIPPLWLPDGHFHPQVACPGRACARRLRARALHEPVNRVNPRCDLDQVSGHGWKLTRKTAGH
jgi:hypothetical protein